MKRIIPAAFAAAFLLFACNNEKKTDEPKTETTAASDSAKEETTAFVPVDSATAEKAWIAYATPGSVHQMLAKSNGNWTAQITMWMTEGAPPMTSTGKSSYSMIMGGRYQLGKFSGNMMGMPFEGQSIIGYDNAKKIFVSDWIDNMGTGVMSLSGPWDEAAKTVTLTGKQVDPTTGKDCDIKETFQIIDDNTQLMTMYGPDPKTGKQHKSMEIKFTRSK